MKKYMIYCIFVLFGFTIFGRGKVDKEAQPNKQSSENVSENKNEIDKEDILSAFRFWVNKNAWLYGDCEYVDINMKVDVYYRKTEDNRYLGYLYIRKNLSKKRSKQFVKNYLKRSERQVIRFLYLILQMKMLLRMLL